MRQRLPLLLAALFLAGCAGRPPHPQAFAFALIGDTPYNAREELEFDALLGELGAEPLAFVVHVGDVKGGDAPCTDALYADRRARLDASRHALVLTPGDNDWTDCRRRPAGGNDPLERLGKLRKVFFSDTGSLGHEPMPLAVQEDCAEFAGGRCRCPGLPENRLWTKNGVVFATIHVVGSNDNRGFDAANDAEQRCRGAANRRWIDHALARARSPESRGLALFMQANPWGGSRGSVYEDLVEQLAAGARRLAKPLLVAHGDTHLFQADRPFRDGDGNPMANTLRVVAIGSPMVGWVRVAVDPDDPGLFRAEPHAGNDRSGG